MGQETIYQVILMVFVVVAETMDLAHASLISQVGIHLAHNQIDRSEYLSQCLCHFVQMASPRFHIVVILGVPLACPYILILVSIVRAS